MKEFRLTKNIPEHLERFTVKQDYSLYTPMDQAGWRYIMRISRDFFKDYAHKKYLDGLPATGISIEKIPVVEEMDKQLQKLGWRAVVVSGFIPPSIFMEFLSLGILPIACDMRTHEHLSYTPAPDIVHEAAGHAPIIADPEYSHYLRAYGEVARKVIFTKEDMDVYEAVRHLSDTKEDPKSTPVDIEKANLQLDAAVTKVKDASEANLLARMFWWTAEYGLIGSIDKPLIYGAGLLSSVGESYECLSSSVQKVPFSVDCIHTYYDITKPQPQLFVAPDFQALTQALEDFSQTMAFRLGGEKALRKGLSARTITTTVLESGLQISGVIEHFSSDPNKFNEILTVIFRGPLQVSENEKEIIGPKNLSSNLTLILNVIHNDRGELQDSSGRLYLDIEKEIKLSNGSKVWITSDGRLLTSAKKVISVFGDAADRVSFYTQLPGPQATQYKQKTNLTNENKKLNELYQKMRDIREKNVTESQSKKEIASIYSELKTISPEDWLLRLEILELLNKKEVLYQNILNDLKSIILKNPEKKTLITRGLALIDEKI